MYLRAGLLTVLFLTSLAPAHIVLKSPKPYKFPAYGHSNPIDPKNPDWPCKLPGGAGKLQIDGSPTQMVAGEPQTLGFDRGNGAVHGGGSCQLSLLPGFSPSKDNADFRVIKSFVGGCPAKNEEGNLKDGEDSDKYNFTIPKDVPAGDYTFSWTWVQRIGGAPEYYQNCAPITVTSTSSSSNSSEFLKTLPPVFMANMGPASKGCTASAAWSKRKSLRYPNPGNDVEYPEGDKNLFAQIAECDGNPFAKEGGGNGPASSHSSTPNTVPAPSESKPTPKSSNKPKPEPDTSLSVTSTPSTLRASPRPKPSIQDTSLSVTPTLSTLKASPRPKPSIPASNSPLSTHTQTRCKPEPKSTATSMPKPPTPNQGNTTETCQDGYLRCNPDQVSFSTCTGGQFRAPIPLAQGTKCKAGVGVGLDIIVS